MMDFEYGIWVDPDTVKNVIEIVSIQSWGIHPFAIFDWLGLEEVVEVQSSEQKVNQDAE